MKPFVLLLALGLLLHNCTTKEELSVAQKDRELTDYVNPFIGTGGHGHTYPGATLPFGMMQLSPDTRLDGWDGCSGYHYSDTSIFGFSHTHLSGTGVSDYGDILLMPTNEINFHNGADGKKGYNSTFSHDTEEASPGYYKVSLDATQIEVELTVSKRSGMHKYQFPNTTNQIVILDLEHRDEVLDAQITKTSETELVGYRHSKAWASKQMLYFAIETSHPFKEVPQSAKASNTPDNLRSALVFNNPSNQPVYIKIGISAVDVEGAKNNLKTEIGDKTFEVLRNEAKAQWETQLEKIVVESADTDYKTNFYTALYHSMLAPNLYQDVDGRYRGMDLEIHQTTEFDYYTVFSLWDTYRAAHPLYTIIEQERTNDFINTFLAKYDEGGIMPIWDLSACYTGCMIGYHAVPVIADAYLKGIRGFDHDKALEAMKHSSMQEKLGLDTYKSLGYIPVESESESVSKTLEYAYDDWTIAQMAKAMGRDEDYKTYLKRAQNYKNLFDPESGFMRGRFRNTWFAPFDPYEVNFNYTEANAWQYSNYVPQDISGLMQLHGGKEAFEARLDALFSAKKETSGRNQADITGLIGQYAHGNEPSHHMAYLYNFVNRPHKTQEKVRQILTELYSNAPNGIAGNEDCGQMSAWYVFSSMGFYPVTPGSNQYIIGSPLLDKASIKLENGHSFTMVANSVSKENKYVKHVLLNGEPLNRTYLTHEELMAGGVLEFEMTNTLSAWGVREGEEPTTAIDAHQILPAPFIAKGDVAFKHETTIVLESLVEEAEIYYRFNADDFKVYSKPLKIKQAALLEVYSETPGKRSATISTQFYKIDPDMTITLETDYANQYNAGGNDALIDGIMGTEDFRTGTWQGYWNEDVIAIVDLGKTSTISNIKTSFLRDQRSWIFLPKTAHIYTSKDGVNFKKIQDFNFELPFDTDEVEIASIEVTHPVKARYVKLIAKKRGALPEWHLGHAHNGRSWIFIDEIQLTK